LSPLNSRGDSAETAGPTHSEYKKKTALERTVSAKKINPDCFPLPLPPLLEERGKAKTIIFIFFPSPLLERPACYMQTSNTGNDPS